jgi:hypothetical protein
MKFPKTQKSDDSTLEGTKSEEVAVEETPLITTNSDTTVDPTPPVISGLTVSECIEEVEKLKTPILNAIRESFITATTINTLDSVSAREGTCSVNGMKVSYDARLNHASLEIIDFSHVVNIKYKYEISPGVIFNCTALPGVNNTPDRIIAIEFTSNALDAIQVLYIINPNSDYMCYTNRVDAPKILIHQEKNNGNINDAVYYRSSQPDGNFINRVDYFLNDKFTAVGYAEHTYVNPTDMENPKTLLRLEIKNKDSSPFIKRSLINAFNGDIINSPIVDTINSFFDNKGNYLVDTAYHPEFTIGLLFQLYCEAVDKNTTRDVLKIY